MIDFIIAQIKLLCTYKERRRIKEARLAKELEQQRLQAFVQSQRYKDSGVVMQLINDKYALKPRQSEIQYPMYIDLATPAYNWNMTALHFKDCCGTIDDCIAAFDARYPVVKEPIVEKPYCASDYKINKTF